MLAKEVALITGFLWFSTVCPDNFISFVNILSCELLLLNICLHIIQYHIVVFLVVTSCSDVIEYQCFRGPCCLHLQIVIPYSDVVGYQHFRGSYCLHRLWHCLV